MTTEYSRGLFDFIIAADRAAAAALIEEWAETRSHERAAEELLEPALQLLGERWSKEEDVSLAQGYVAGKIAEDLLTKIAVAQASRTPVQKKGPVVMGNIEDDYHSLGRKLVVTFLRTAGWEVHDLGNDVPAADFVDKALEVGARVIGASGQIYSIALNMKKLRDEIDGRGLKGKIQFAVGGAIFVLRPEVVEEVGGDGTARNAMGAPALMEELWARAVREGGAG